MSRSINPQFISMIHGLSQLPGGEAVDNLANVLSETAPSVGVRFNPLKGEDPEKEARRVTWARNGIYVDGERPRFTLDPAMHQGRYYVQDPSSMVMETIVGDIVNMLGADSRLLYVDMCAAPGGKTTAAMASLPAGSLVIANEFDRRRAEILRENIIKWGYPDAVVTSGDTSRLVRLGAIADIVAADVPCSGEGMMRKEEAAVTQWSPSLVTQCASLQREIIDNAWRILRPGGYFIYSTCTFNRAEDEENLAYIIEQKGGEPVDMHLSERFPPIAPSIGSPYPAARFIPGRAEGEGLFVAIVRKPGDVEAAAEKIQDRGDAKGGQTVKLPNELSTWLADDGRYLKSGGESVYSLPSRWKTVIADIEKTAKVIYAGVEIAVVKGRDYIPSQALAMSALLNRGAFPSVDVDRATALQYLSRQAITLDDAPRGIVLLTYQDCPLGFVKNIGNRANNLYPQPWAIRTTHLQ